VKNGSDIFYLLSLIDCSFFFFCFCRPTHVFNRVIYKIFNVFSNLVSFSIGVHSKNKYCTRFGECYTCYGRETKTGTHIFWLFPKIGLYSAISWHAFETSRRELSIDMAEHRSMLENYQNTHYSRFSFTPKTGTAFPKTILCFYCVKFFNMMPANSIKKRTLYWK